LTFLRKFEQSEYSYPSFFILDPKFLHLLYKSQLEQLFNFLPAIFLQTIDFSKQFPYSASQVFDLYHRGQALIDGLEVCSRSLQTHAGDIRPTPNTLLWLLFWIIG
jgi:hypothetical protein